MFVGLGVVWNGWYKWLKSRWIVRRGVVGWIGWNKDCGVCKLVIMG